MIQPMVTEFLAPKVETSFDILPQHARMAAFSAHFLYLQSEREMKKRQDKIRGVKQLKRTLM